MFLTFKTLNHILHQIIIFDMPVAVCNKFLVLFEKKTTTRFRSSWLKTTYTRKSAKCFASAYPWVKLPKPWFPFLTYYDQIVRVRKKIDQELHLKINVLKIKRYIWCNIVHQKEREREPFRKCRGMEFHNCACKDRFYLSQIIQSITKR